MGLIATFNGERIESHKSTPEEWRELKLAYKKGTLTMGCGQPAVPKAMSKSGFQFFAHKPGVDCNIHEGGPETREHLAAKAAIAEAAVAAGWVATIESPSQDRSWIADVLVEKDGRKIAMEVQWSNQSPEDFTRRQERYERYGVECLWFVWERNRFNAQGVPSVLLHGGPEGLIAELPNGLEEEPLMLGINEAVAAHLTGEYMRHVEALTRGILLWVVEKDCYRPGCGKPLSIWYVRGIDFETRCGLTGSMEDLGPLPLRPKTRFESGVALAVMKLIRESDLNEPAFMAPRHSSRAKESYLAYCCPHCEVVQSDSYHSRSQGLYAVVPTPLFRLALSDEAIEIPHLCKDRGHGYCQPDRSAEVRWPHGPSADIAKLCEPLQDQYSLLPAKGQRERERAEAVAARAEREARQAAYDLALSADSFPSALLRMHPPRRAAPLTTERPPEIQDDRMQLRWKALLGDKRPEESPEPDTTTMSAEECVASLGQKRLRLAIFHALEHLDCGSLHQVEAARAAKGEANLYPILLGDLYPKSDGA